MRLSNPVELIDEMIDEIFEPRKMSRPALGGGKSAPFDGELLGKFIRFVVLNEVRDRMLGMTHTETEMIEGFNQRWKAIER
jgi:hypothetical protein